MTIDYSNEGPSRVITQNDIMRIFPNLEHFKHDDYSDTQEEFDYIQKEASIVFKGIQVREDILLIIKDSSLIDTGITKFAFEMPSEVFRYNVDIRFKLPPDTERITFLINGKSQEYAIAGIRTKTRMTVDLNDIEFIVLGNERDI